MGFACQCIDNGGPRTGLIFAALVGKQVIHQPRGRAHEDGVGIGQRFGKVLKDNMTPEAVRRLTPL